MRDQTKQCGITVHQLLSPVTNKDKLGDRCPEYSFKEKSKKRKQFPPSDYISTSYLGILDPAEPFSLFVWYMKLNNDAPDVCCVDLLVDGKRSPGWVVRAGRKNGIRMDSIISKLDSNFIDNASKNRERGGSIQATFWRGILYLLVMKLDDSDEFIPDEGVPALAILNIEYRDMKFLTQAGIVKKKTIHNLQLKSELSTTLSSPVVNTSRTFDFSALEELEAQLEIKRPPFKLIDVTSTAENKDIFDELNEMDSDLPPAKKRKTSWVSFEDKAPSPKEKENKRLEAQLKTSIFTMNAETVDAPPVRRKRIPLKVQSGKIYRITVDYDNTIEMIENRVQSLLKSSQPLRLEWQGKDNKFCPFDGFTHNVFETMTLLRLQPV